MKKLIILASISCLALGASAQRIGHGRGPVVHRPAVRTHVIVRSYPAYRYGPAFYDPFYSPYYQSYPYRESRLELQLEDIRSDYKDRIWSARHDKDLSRKERKVKVHELKHERDQAIIEEKQTYYRR